MRIVQTISSLQKALDGLPHFSPSLAFVPTMGALHQGHLNLVKAAKSMANNVVASIFVNPTQFNNPSDFAKYPKSLEADIALLEAEGTDILFLPTVEEIYPNGLASTLQYPLGQLENLLEGAHRPGHFQGVCQVVHRLLEAVQPGILCMGQKDFQQCMVVQQLIDYLGMPIKMHIVPTMREPDGLAMSSRNRRLSEADKQTALAMIDQLRLMAAQPNPLHFREMEQAATRDLLEAGYTSVDYVSIAVADTLQPAQEQDANRPLVALAAAFLGEVRLIDNVLLPLSNHGNLS
ncbi:MAG TPA: pantoate--beta-alanine ligase [Phnomibacter sp.]|nr:pantoate--beta-alanine ligase [Phnomibacter sp.]